jgi:Protein of unknown function (DUF1579)
MTQSRSTETKAAAAPARPGPEHERLGIFAGRWNMQGRALESPFGPAAPITAAQDYEWLAGGLFLVHRLYGRMGGDEIACVEVIGYDPLAGHYTIDSFYNNGTRSVWRLEGDGRTWTISGSWPVDGEKVQARCTTAFDASGRSARGTWEYSRDGVRWQPFWETELSRA